jgi:hypothetical protein
MLRVNGLLCLIIFYKSTGMNHIKVILPSVACLAPPHFSTLAFKRHDFRRKKLSNIKCKLYLFETFLILRRIQQDIVVNIKTSSSKVPVILFRFQRNFDFLDGFLEKARIPNFRQNPSSWSRVVPCGQTDKRTDVHEEANSRFSQFCEGA